MVYRWLHIWWAVPLFPSLVPPFRPIVWNTLSKCGTEPPHRTLPAVLVSGVQLTLGETCGRVSWLPCNPCPDRALADYQPFHTQRWCTCKIWRECDSWFPWCGEFQDRVRPRSLTFEGSLWNQCRWWMEPWTGLSTMESHEGIWFGYVYPNHFIVSALFEVLVSGCFTVKSLKAVQAEVLLMLVLTVTARE